MKLGLGTAQFGLKYGINNHTGKPSLTAVKDILQCAWQNKIKLLDTASDYGDSEKTLGNAIASHDRFAIITKLSKEGDTRASIASSLKRLNLDRLDGVLVHDFDQFVRSPQHWGELQQAKKEGLVSKIGFSLYLPGQLKKLFDQQIDFDLLQVPYNIFDQRFEGWFEPLKQQQVEIHIRSAFVQGLVFSDIEKLSAFFEPLKPKLHRLANLSRETGKSIQSLCLNFVNSNKLIDHVIIGVDSRENLESNVRVLSEKLSNHELDILRSLREDNEEMILPYKWKP